ncbi:MAG: T9SS type A sorting domain-containing protein [Flavobacteriaceae bacterium]|nr:T9SS type A sorting domain-containing protein [Flavobacteriaceae bacterium]
MKTNYFTGIGILFLALMTGFSGNSQTVDHFKSGDASSWLNYRFKVRDYILDQGDDPGDDDQKFFGADNVWNFEGYIGYPWIKDDPERHHPRMDDVWSVIEPNHGGATILLRTDADYSDAWEEMYLRNEDDDPAKMLVITQALGDDFKLRLDNAGPGEGTGLDRDHTGAGRIGAFPLSYGDRQISWVKGRVEASGRDGKFLGTCDALVNASGLLTLTNSDSAEWPMGTGVVDVPVTRLRIEVNVNITVLKGGKAIQVYNYYYSNETSEMIFRTSYLYYRIDAGIFGIQKGKKVKIYSLYSSDVLSTSSEKLANVQFQINPSLVDEVLNINVNDSEKIESAVITDIIGRTILEANGPSVQVGHLNSGVYFLTVSTKNGSTTKKFVKK